MLALSLIVTLLQLPVPECPPIAPIAPTPRPIAASKPTVDHPDESDFFPFVFALDGGGGASAQKIPSVFGGLKIGFECCIEGKHPYETGRTITLDLGYDRADRHHGI